MQNPRGGLLQDPVFRAVTAAGGLLLLGAFAAWHYNALLSAAGGLLHILRPLLLGVLFATMLEPPFTRLQTDFARFACKHHRNPAAKWIMPFSLAGAVIPPLAVLCSIVCILIPQLMQSVRLFTENFGFYSSNLQGMMSRYADTALAKTVPAARIEELLGSLQTRLPEFLRKTYDYTASAVEVLLDLGIGTVFSLYLLADRHRLSAQFRTVCTRLAGKQRTARITAQARRVCSTFARFLSSQCKEALMLGALCWLGMTLLHFPYPVLISVIIGVTNIVPYIGPLAGTVPAVLLLLLIQPRSAVWFVVFIVVLQQLESNLIYPRVVGSSVGLPPAWVLAAIVICGGLWGAGGMLLGVPLAAVLYAVLFPEEA